jgi:hypothetical protein
MGRRSSSLLLLFASFAAAQSLESLLPAGAKIIEAADVSAIAKKPRVLVLWMVNPAKHVRDSAAYCGDAIYGDYWEGPTRLSLIEGTQRRLINTITIKIDEEWTGHADSFMLPFFVSNEYYSVLSPDEKKEGMPKILHLRDFTGEGAPLQFPLFAYEVCGVSDTGLFGYSILSDQALQYSVVTQGHGKKISGNWVSQVFAMRPVSPGHWKFTWGPGHGVSDLIDEDVTFDRVGQRFITKSVVRHVK